MKSKLLVLFCVLLLGLSLLAQLGLQLRTDLALADGPEFDRALIKVDILCN